MKVTAQYFAGHKEWTIKFSAKITIMYFALQKG